MSTYNSSRLLTLVSQRSAEAGPLEMTLHGHGFRTTHYLVATDDDVVSHEGCDGEEAEVTKAEFVEAYPDALGAIWHVEEK